MLLCSECEGNGRHGSAGLRDPLVVIVGEAALEVGLETEGAGDHVPGTIVLLRAEEVIDATPVNGIGSRRA